MSNNRAFVGGKPVSRTESFNLNIQMYSFPELLRLFELPDASSITHDQLKRAKMTVLRTHPDKSRLPPEYFLFYKKAFEIIVDFYNNQQKTTKAVPQTEMKYSHEIFDSNTGTGSSSSSVKESFSIMENIEALSPAKFHETFNDLFEKNQMGQQIVNHNEWFSNENGDNDDPYSNLPPIKNASSLNTTFEKIKEKQHDIVIYNGFKEIATPNVSCANIYDDEYDATIYIESDPFSKLKFDDIKKVHKNETVFSVGEKDYEKVAKYNSVEDYNSARSIDNISLKTEEENRRILKEKEIEFQNRMIIKEYNAKKKEMEIEKKNKSIISYFLHLT